MGVYKKSEFISKSGGGDSREEFQAIERNLDLFHASTGRRKFAYACMTFDACIQWWIKTIYVPKEAHPEKVKGYQAVMNLREQLLKVIQSVGKENWLKAIQQMGETSKPLDHQYKSEMLCFGEVRDDWYLMFNHGGDARIPMAKRKAEETRQPDKYRKWEELVGLKAETIKKTAATLFPTGVGPTGVDAVPTDAFVLSRTLTALDGGIRPLEVYMRKRKRETFRITIRGDGKAVKADGIQFDTGGEFWIWAISASEKYGFDLFAAPTQIGHGLEIQHASFFKGAPVLCAGTVMAENGSIIRLCNDSGHYKPRPSDLQKACEKLVQKGLRACTVEVVGWHPDSTRRPLFDIRNFATAGFKTIGIGYSLGKGQDDKLEPDVEKSTRSSQKFNTEWPMMARQSTWK
jgi:hypothetical protein